MVEPLSLQKNMMWNSIGSMVYLVCTWLTTVLAVILSSGYDASGQLAVAMAVGNIFATIVLFRIRPVQISDHDPSHTTGDYVFLRVATTLVAMFFCLAYSALTVSPSNYITVALYLLFKWTDSFVDVFQAVDQKNGRLDYAAISQIIRGALLLCSFVVGLTLFDSLNIAIFGSAVSSLLVVMLYDIPKSAQFGKIKPTVHGRIIKSLFVTCFPGFLSSLLVTMVVSVARQQYGLDFGNSLLGIYAAVATPTAVVQALASYIYAPLYGPMSDAWEKCQIHKIQNFILKVLLALFGILLCCIVLSIAFGGMALAIVYGSDVSSYAYLLPGILCCTCITAAVQYLVDMLIVFRDGRGAIITGVVSMIACVVLIPVVFSENDLNSISLTIVLSYACGLVCSLACIVRDISRRKREAIQS